MKTRFVIAGVLAGLLAGCAGASGPAVDLEAEKTALLEADRAWSETVGDAAGFAGYFEPQGRIMPPSDPTVTGREAIQSTAEEMFASEGFALTWKADSADVSGDASLGYTTGTYEITFAGPDGNPSTSTGSYTTVWKKQADGSWKVAVDCVSSDAPTPAPAPAPASEEQ